VLWKPRPEGVQPQLYRFAWKFLLVAFRRYRFRVVNREGIPKRGGVLIVCNHVADVDPPFISVAVRPRPAEQLAAARHFVRQPLAWLMGSLGAFPLRTDRPDAGAIRHARDRLAQGRLIVIFPEGAPSFSDRLGPFQSGVGHLALVPGILVIPAAIWGTQRVLRRGLPIGRGPVTLIFGPPVRLPEGGSRKERAAAATEAIRAAVGELVAALAAADRAKG
jgi:1-acyl-sn-glycerol-3-phosphate acyltransferase